MISKALNKLISWGLSILIFILSLFGFQPGGGENTELLTYNDAHTALTVTLSENASTAYSWSYTASVPDVVRLTADTFTPASSEPAVAGAPGTRAFTFEGAAEGTVLLTFAYARPWENDPVDTVTIRCVVSSDLTIEAEVIAL